VHKAHLEAIQELEEQTGVKINHTCVTYLSLKRLLKFIDYRLNYQPRYHETPSTVTGGPIGKFRSIGDNEPVPAKPDNLYYINKLEVGY